MNVDRAPQLHRSVELYRSSHILAVSLFKVPRTYEILGDEVYIPAPILDQVRALMARSTKPAYASMLRHNQDTANEARLRKYEEQLKAAKDKIQELSTTITIVRQTLTDALEGGNTAEAPAVVYTLASEVYDDDYRRACEQAEKMWKERSAGAAASERAACDIGHKYVKILTNRAFSQQSTHAGYAKAEKVMLEILKKERRLIQQGRLVRSSILESQRQYCSILCQLASFEKPNNEKAAEEMLKRVETVRRSIWERRDDAQGLSQNDARVLESGHQLGLVLAELKKPGEDQYRLAEIQFREVLNARKTALGPTHDDTVDSALQLVSMLEKQTKLDEKKKRADIKDILEEIWSLRRLGMTAGLLSCGHKLGEQFRQQQKDRVAENVLNEVWMVRKGAIERVSKEGNEARSTGYLLAEALYSQGTREKYESAKIILEKLWESGRYYVSPHASPPNDFIGWRLAWTYQKLEDYQRAEPIFQDIWESRKNGLEADHAETLLAQYELAFVQGLRERWAAAQRNFQYVWERTKHGIEGVSETQNAALPLHAGHNLGICLSAQKRYRAAVTVLTEVYNRRERSLGKKAEETQTTLKKLEEAKKARALQKEEEKKASVERARVEARKPRVKQERKPATKWRAAKR